jgi:hypothetical protein
MEFTPLSSPMSSGSSFFRLTGWEFVIGMTFNGVVGEAAGWWVKVEGVGGCLRHCGRCQKRAPDHNSPKKSATLRISIPSLILPELGSLLMRTCFLRL